MRRNSVIVHVHGETPTSRDVVFDQPAASPLVKWAGGKQWLASAAPALLPPEWRGVYYEPFMGGGAMFFALRPAKAVLADQNQELIAMYTAVRENPEAVIRFLRNYRYDSDFFYRIREAAPRIPAKRAARFLYLNKACWNGLYRVNQRGRFNTPFGQYANPTICDEPRIRAASGLLKGAALSTCDFSQITAKVKPGDFVYLDPPYITGHSNNGFSKYDSRLFSWADQERLAEEAIDLSCKGAYVLVSNADRRSVVSLYSGFYYYRVRRRTLIAGKTASRRIIHEALLANYPILGCFSEVIS